MVPRYTRLVLSVLLLMATGLCAAHAQERDAQATALTSQQRSKLDGRLTRILEHAADERLEAAIRSQSPARAPSAFRRSTQSFAVALERASGIALAQEQSRSARPLPRYSFTDVQPDARTPGGDVLYDAIVHTRNPAALVRAGVQVTAFIDGVATVRGTPDALSQAAALRSVERIASPRLLFPHNDTGTGEVGATALNRGAVNETPYTGTGIIGCVIDSGIDWSHPDFTADDGSSRILSIWDQDDDTTGTPSPAERDPSRFSSNFNPNFGAEWTRSDVETGVVLQQDRDGHGTHVTGTLASSGRAYRASSGAKRYQGAAPSVDIVTVKAGDAGFSTTNVITGIQYCQQVAQSEGKPVVINMSLGTDFAPHDGSSDLSSVVDELTSTGTTPGTVVITSAGNSGSPSRSIHVQSDLRDGSPAEVSVTVPSYTPREGAVNDFFVPVLYTYAPGAYTLTATAPNGSDTVSLEIPNDSSNVDTFASTSSGSIFMESFPDGNGRAYYLEVFDEAASMPVAEGTWTVSITGNDGQSTPVHGWFLLSQLGEQTTTFDGGDNAYTIGSPATSQSAIAVGNYWQRTQWYNNTLQGGIAFNNVPLGIIASSSSRGPTVDDRMKPDISAPGTVTASALSDDTGIPSDDAFVLGDGEHQMLSGTSMSAPLVAGSVALLLEEQADLTTNDVRDLLAETARVDNNVATFGAAPNTTFGAGKLDVRHAMLNLIGQEESPSERLRYHAPFAPTEAPQTVVGGETVPRAALRFTPTYTGQPDGAYMTLGSQSLSLTDSVHVEVWTDEGGAPGRRIGERVAVPPSAIRPFSPHFIPLDGIGAALVGGVDYHLVVAPQGSSQLPILRSTSTTGRSQVFNGAAWVQSQSDLVLEMQTRFLYPDALQANITRTLGGAEATDYRLVSIPGDVGRDLSEVLSGEPGIAWTAFWDTGSDSDALMQYDGSDTFTAQPGRGFWVASLEALTFSEQVPTVSLTDGATTIPLHAGWNIIANPFDLDVDWASVEAANGGSLQPLWAFDGAFETTAALRSAASGEAFYFFNDTEREQLTLPYPGAPSGSAGASRAAAQVAAGGAPTLLLQAQHAAAGAKAPTSTARLTLGSERSDVVAPSSDFEAVSVRFVNTEADATSRTRLLAHTARSFHGDGAALPMSIRASDASTVQVTLQNREVLRGASAVLIDDARGTTYDLTSSAGVPVEVGDSPAFTLAIGSEAFVEEQVAATLPKDIRLRSAPNPFRERATLTYTLPSASDTRLEVYDLLGRRVATLVNGPVEAGTHTVSWTPTRVASGVYFARLVTEQRSVVHKITVVR